MGIGSSISRITRRGRISAGNFAGVQLLGKLPTLTDRTSDSRLAGIAAHCVHQIRAKLQMSRTNNKPHVIAVTSAGNGDGKTCMALALALSYAACGARTLLIDCDLVTAGLSRRLKLSCSEGVIEAVANASLLRYMLPNAIGNVAILPVGTTHANGVSTLPRAGFRQLFDEGRTHFDVIFVDTGAILGSREAGLICADVDRTILTVARNQQRSLVEKSIAFLRPISADLAGLVFNRAYAEDVNRNPSRWRGFNSGRTE